MVGGFPHFGTRRWRKKIRVSSKTKFVMSRSLVGLLIWLLGGQMALKIVGKGEAYGRLHTFQVYGVNQKVIPSAGIPTTRYRFGVGVWVPPPLRARKMDEIRNDNHRYHRGPRVSMAVCMILHPP